MKVGKLLLILAVACAGFAFASMPIQKQSAGQITRGKKLFASYCASCHGVDATGNGPVASSLKALPSDLTRIQAKSGKFSAEDVRKKIAGSPDLMVHGKKDMPVWGLIFSSSDITNLVKYLESIQRPFAPQPAG